MFRPKRYQETQTRAGLGRSSTAANPAYDCENTTRHHRMMFNLGSIKREILGIILFCELFMIHVEAASDHEDQDSLLIKYGQEGICVLERANIDKIMNSIDENFKISAEIDKVLKFTNKVDKSDDWSGPSFRNACQNMQPLYTLKEEQSRLVDEIADKLIIAIDEAMAKDPKYKFFKPVRAKGTFEGHNDYFDQIIKYSAVKKGTRHKCHPHVDGMQPHLRALLVVQNTEEGGELFAFDSKRFRAKDGSDLSILDEDDKVVTVATEEDGAEHELIRGRNELEVVLLDQATMKKLGYDSNEIPRKDLVKGLECEVYDRDAKEWVKCEYMEYVPFKRYKVKIDVDGVTKFPVVSKWEDPESKYERIRGPHTTENFPIAKKFGEELPKGWKKRSHRKSGEVYYNRFLKKRQKELPSRLEDSMADHLPVLGSKVLSKPGDLVLIPSSTFQRQNQFLFKQSSMFGAKHMVTPVRGKTDRIRVSFDMALVKREGYAKCPHCHEKNFACEERRVMKDAYTSEWKWFKLHRVGGNHKHEKCSECDGTGYVDCCQDAGCKKCQQSEYHVTHPKEWPSESSSDSS